MTLVNNSGYHSKSTNRAPWLRRVIAGAGLAVAIGALSTPAAEAAQGHAAPSGPSATATIDQQITAAPASDWPWPKFTQPGLTSGFGATASGTLSAGIIPSCPLGDWPWLCH